MSTDLMGEIRAVPAGTPASFGAWQPVVGDLALTTVDSLGFGAVVFLIGLQTGATGAANLILEESDDGTTWSAVPNEDIRNRSASAGATAGLVGTLTAVTGRLVAVGVLTKRRYYRVRQANSSGPPAGNGAIIALLGDAVREPVTLTAW